jgi:outer membrane protein TolC
MSKTTKAALSAQKATDLMETSCEPKNMREGIAQALEDRTPNALIVKQLAESPDIQRLGKALHRSLKLRARVGQPLTPGPGCMPLLP